MKGKKQKKGFPWMIAASVSILLVLSFGLVYNFNQSEESSLAKIELGQSELMLSDAASIQIPQIEKEEPREKVKMQKKAPVETKERNQAPLKVEEMSRMAALEKIESIEARLDMNMIPEMRLSPQKQENEVIVEIHYAYAETQKEENLIVKSNNKLKSLASEFSLAELRSAKNDLFASALQFNKKENN